MKNTNPEIHFKKPPALLAVWPGAGNMGIMAVDYLRLKLKARTLPLLDLSKLVFPLYVPVQDGVLKEPYLPKIEFHFIHNPEMILVESNVNLQGNENREVVRAILKVAEDFKVSHLLTLSAMPLTAGKLEQAEVFYSSSSSAFGAELATYGMNPMASGYLYGPEALLPKMAGDKGIKAACLQFGIPLNSLSTPYPEGALEILRTLMSIFNFSIHTGELEGYVKLLNNINSIPEKKLGDNPSENGSQNFSSPLIPAHDVANSNIQTHDPLPKNIEDLFNKVKKDHSYAPELKRELDRLKLYKKYEDKFLKLFRKKTN